MNQDEHIMQELEQQLNAHPQVKYAKISGDGYHYELTLVSEAFDGQPTVARQRWVYAQLGDYITSGRVHALTMKTWTVEEWEKQHG